MELRHLGRRRGSAYPLWNWNKKENEGKVNLILVYFLILFLNGDCMLSLKTWLWKRAETQELSHWIQFPTFIPWSLKHHEGLVDRQMPFTEEGKNSIQIAQVRIPAYYCVTWGQVLNLAEPQLSHLWNERKGLPPLIRLVCGWNEKKKKYKTQRLWHISCPSPTNIIYYY